MPTRKAKFILTDSAGHEMALDGCDYTIHDVPPDDRGPWSGIPHMGPRVPLELRWGGHGEIATMLNALEPGQVFEVVSVERRGDPDDVTTWFADALFRERLPDAD